MAKLILKTKEYLDQFYKTDTPLNAVAKYLNLDDTLVNIALNSLDTTLSLDELRDSDTSLYNKIASKPLNIDTKIDLQTMINTLESPDKEIILLRYFNDYTQDELAKKFGKSRSYITNSLGLLRLPDDTKKYVEDNKLSMSHARALSKLDDTEQINRLANKIVNENLNVRAIENITRDIHEQEIKKETDENTLFEFKQYDTLNTNHIYEDAMREKFGIKVKITGKKIEIPYSSQLELQRILELMDVKIEG